MDRSSKNQPPGKLLNRGFFEAPPERVARRLLANCSRAGQRPAGWPAASSKSRPILARTRKRPIPRRTRIAAPRREIRCFSAPRALRMFIPFMGCYFCMNFSCQKRGQAEASCFARWSRWPGSSRWRAIAACARMPQPANSPAAPAACARRLGLPAAEDNGLDLLDPNSPLAAARRRIARRSRAGDGRIGIRHAAELPLRFAIAGNDCVSGPKY